MASEDMGVSGSQNAIGNGADLVYSLCLCGLNKGQ